jgi:hypothetical protein
MRIISLRNMDRKNRRNRCAGADLTIKSPHLMLPRMKVRRIWRASQIKRFRW